MGIFGFGKKRQEEKSVESSQQEDGFINRVQSMGIELLSLYSSKTNTSFEQTTELERQILAVYLFGMANGLLSKEKISHTPLQIETDITAVLVTVFRYSLPQAQDFVKGMIFDLQSKDSNNPSYAIIHRGLDGYFAYSAGKKSEVIDDVSNIIMTLQTR